MKPLLLRQKILAFLSLCVTLGFLIIETIFLLTERYITVFIDIFGQITILFVLTFVIAQTVILIQKTVANRRIRNILCIVLSITIIILTTTTRAKFDTTNLTVYRTDLGLQAYYLYLDEKQNRFVLKYTYPFGKTTITGKYVENDSIINFDKNLKESFDLQIGQTGFKTNTLDLRKMEKL